MYIPDHGDRHYSEETQDGEQNGKPNDTRGNGMT